MGPLDSDATFGMHYNESCYESAGIMSVFGRSKQAADLLLGLRLQSLDNHSGNADGGLHVGTSRGESKHLCLDPKSKPVSERYF